MPTARESPRPAGCAPPAARAALICLQTPAFSQLFDLFKDQGRLVRGPRVLVALAHFRQGGVALFGRGVPVDPVPFRPEQLAERVTRRKAHPHPVGAELLDRRDAQILRLADTHSGPKLTVGAPGSQAGELRFLYRVIGEAVAETSRV